MPREKQLPAGRGRASKGGLVPPATCSDAGQAGTGAVGGGSEEGAMGQAAPGTRLQL